MAPRGERPPRAAGEGGRGRGGRGGRGARGARGARGEGDTRGAPSPSGEGDADSTVPKPNAKPAPAPAPAAKQKKPSKVSAAQRAVAAERARLDAAAAEEAARAEAARLAAEAEATRARELLAEEKMRAAAARARRSALRAENADAARRFTSDDLKRLDSSIKKNTALTKKLGKIISADTLDSLASDVASTNASKYVAENARAIVFSATIKPSSSGDVLAAAEVVSLLHRMYFPEFGEALSCLLPRAICPEAPERAFANLNLREPEKRWKEKAEKSERGGPRSDASFAAEAFSPSVGNVECAIDSPAQRRARLRLLAEAHLVGAVASAKPAFAAVTELIRSADFARDKERFAHVLASLAAFAKTYGEAFVREEEEDDGHEIEANEKDGETFAARDAKEKEKEKEKPYRLSPERRGAFRDALRSFHVAASVALLDERRAARDAERETKAALARTGELSESLTLRVAELEKSRESLRKNLEVLTEALGGEARGVRMPPDVDDEKAGDGKPKGDVLLSRGVDAGASRIDAASWDDEASRAFYESLPALRETTPRGLLPPDPKTDPKNEAVHLSGARSDAEPSSQTEPSAETSARLAEFDTKVASRLRRCETWTSHADADAFASAFCYFGAGPAARRLVAEAFVAAVESASLASESDTATTPTALLARALATLAGASAVFDAEIKDFVVDATRASTEKHYWDVTRAETSKKEERNRHSASVSSRETEKRHLGSVRFMGELVKFRALDPEWAFDFLKKGVDAFAGRALDAACALLQTCGRYLARRRDTARRTDALLDVFLRRKAVSAARLEPGQSELVDATVLACRPPPVAARRKPSRHPMRAYVAFVVDRLCREWRPPPPGVASPEAARGADVADVAKDAKGASALSSRGDDAVRRCVRQLRKVRWAEHGRYAASRLLKGATRSGRVESAAGAARAVATLDRFRANAAQMFVDALLEETAVLAGIDDARKRARFAQRRVALGRALGEAFVARLVPATTVFAQLYTLLVEELGVTADGGSGPNGPEPGGRDAFFEKHVRVRVALATLAACRPRLAPDVFVPAVSKNVTKNADVKGKEKVKTRRKVSFETRRYLAYFQRFAFIANVGASPELSAELRAALAEYPGHSGDEAFAFATFADADAACARLEAEERAKRQRAGPEASSAGPEASSAAGTAGGTSDESDSGAESEAEDEDELRENFEDSGSDVGDADDTVGDADDGVDVGGGAESDALEDSDSARSQSEENDASDDDASRDLLDTSASESASESDSDERAGFDFSSDDSFDDESETRDAKTFGGEHSPPRNMPVASREDEARFEREMASFLGSASEPRSVGDEKNDGKASSFAARARGDSSRDAPRRVAFKALVRRDGRATAATVGVPEDASFVVRAREKQAAEARERAELKRLVLLSAEAAEAMETDRVFSGSATRDPPGTFTVLSSATVSRVSGRGRGARGLGGGDRRGS